MLSHLFRVGDLSWKWSLRFLWSSGGGGGGRLNLVFENLNLYTVVSFRKGVVVIYALLL